MKKAVIYIYDSIGEFGIRLNDFIAMINEYEAKGITDFVLHINSSGGSVFDGFAIYNAMLGKNVNVVIDGLAASIASVIAMAGKKISIYKNSFIMVHNPSTFAAGDEREFAKAGKTLEMIKESIVQAYMDRTKLSKEEIEKYMNDESWFGADDALKLGFVDEVIEPVTKDYVGMYVNIIDTKKTKKQSASGGIKEKKMNEKLAKFLGLDKEATEEQIDAKLAELRTEFGLDGDTTLADVIAAATVEEEAEIVEDPRVTAMLETLKKDKTESLINLAINDGKILPADKDVFLNSATLDFAKTKTMLDARAKNFALPKKFDVNNKSAGVKAADSEKDATEYLKAQGRQPLVK